MFEQQEYWNSLTFLESFPSIMHYKFMTDSTQTNRLLEYIRKAADKECWLVINNSINISENVLREVFIEMDKIDTEKKCRIIF